MPTRVGPKTFGQENLIFAYDVGDTTNCYLGEPTENLATLDLDDTSTWYNEDAATTIREKQPETLFGYPVYKIRSKPGQIWRSPVAFNGFDRTVDDVTVSAYIRNVSASATVSTYLGGDYSTDSLGTANSQTINTDGEWRRYQWTRFSGSMVTNQLEFRTSGPGILLSCPQVGYGRRATQLLDGSRSVSGSLLDLGGSRTINISNVSFVSSSKVHFNGTDNDIEISTLTEIIDSDYSVETVIRRNVAGVQHGIVSDYQYSWWIFKVKSDNKAYIRHKWNNTTNVIITGTTNIGTDYTHIAVTFSKATGMKLYVNGELDGSNSSTLPFILAGRGPRYIGHLREGAPGSPNSYFDGEIPVLKFYNRALTTDEVSANFRVIKSRFNI